MRKPPPVLLSAGLAVCLAACVQEYKGSAFQWSTVRALRVGMSDAEVSRAMGGPPARFTSWSTGTKSLTWIWVSVGGEKRSVTLVFGPSGLLSVPDIPPSLPNDQVMEVASRTDNPNDWGLTSLQPDTPQPLTAPDLRAGPSARSEAIHPGVIATPIPTNQPPAPYSPVGAGPVVVLKTVLKSGDYIKVTTSAGLEITGTVAAISTRAVKITLDTGTEQQIVYLKDIVGVSRLSRYPWYQFWKN
jgi:hypothetical protein